MPKHHLSDVAADQLAAAKDSSTGSSSQTLVGSDDSSLEHTVVALTEGRELDESAGTEDATLLVISGTVRVRTAAGPEDASSGELLEVPTEPHTITAEKDTTALLTVSKDPQ